MRNLKLLALMVSFLFTSFAFGQDEEFKPSGKPFMKIFSNYHYGSDNETSFEVKRAYFGYKANLSSKWSTKLTLDVGSADVSINDSTKAKTSLNYTAYLKNALLKYSNGNLGVSFGLIGTKGFKTQEKFWGHRYIYKSFQDAYKFGSSADFGVVVDYKFADFISADLSILNGEGYKKLQGDQYFKSGLGITLKPVKNLVIRAYSDYMNGDDGDAQMTTAFFAGYKIKSLVFGAEYNMQSNNKNNTGEDLNGYSVYASYDINKKWQVFGRYDDLASNTLEGEDTPWNASKDGSAIIAGLQFKPVKGVKLSTNYQGWQGVDSDMEHFGYLNVEIAF